MRASGWKALERQPVAAAGCTRRWRSAPDSTPRNAAERSGEAPLAAARETSKRGGSPVAAELPAAPLSAGFTGPLSKGIPTRWRQGADTAAATATHAGALCVVHIRSQQTSLVPAFDTHCTHASAATHRGCRSAASVESAHWLYGASSGGHVAAQTGRYSVLAQHGRGRGHNPDHDLDRFGPCEVTPREPPKTRAAALRNGKWWWRRNSVHHGGSDGERKAGGNTRGMQQQS
jgi:hypothetical protein